MGRERRRRTRRTARQGAPSVEISAPGDTHTSTAGHHIQVRSDRVLAREAQTMIDELKRVLVVSGVCFGMLAVLVVIERMQ
ncbi:MAG: hypothetical protein KC461_12285 [Dehalococcoidia bacterium]|nr:hypothetical protein [Dehalococcoidia bacterium]MCA9851406.1 hypothetical protein [Dehalococcoidia bacterium]MCB9483013.1 hypothetical protein [Dehalococcoidia bacterium]MCB9491717.1 hypothetical protein [Dehalococcoidia bacterium]